MTRILSIVPKNHFAEAPLVVIIPDSVSTKVLDDLTRSGELEYAYIELFNAGANRAYYCYGADCDSVSNFHGFMEPGVMIEVSVRQQVNIYSVGGTSIATTKIRRHDVTKNANQFVSQI